MTGNRRFRAAILLAAGMAGALQAATCYVATNGTSVSPFNSWGALESYLKNGQMMVARPLGDQQGAG